MNTNLRKKVKNNFEKYIFKLMNSAVFGKTMKNVKKHRNIKIITRERPKKYLVSEQNYHTTKFFTENVLAVEMRKSQILMNKSVYLDLSKLDLSKTVMYEFWDDCVKPKYGKNAKLCFMDAYSFRRYWKQDAETRFDTSHFESDRQLPKRKKKKVIGLMKGELGGQFMKAFVELRSKTYSYLKDNNDEGKKAKSTKKCFIKRKFKFEDYKDCSEGAQIENKKDHLAKSKTNVDKS